MAYFDSAAFRAFIIEVGKSWKEQTPQALPPLPDPNSAFVAFSWSPDGRQLAGFLFHADRREEKIAVYSLESQKFEKLTDFGRGVQWLNDNRRLLFVTGSSRAGTFGERLYLVDSRSKKVSEVLSVTPSSLSNRISISRDNRTIYFGLQVTEADIWLATLQ